MFKSWIQTIKARFVKPKMREEDIVREQIRALYREFQEGEGRLPEGFSDPYNQYSPDGYHRSLNTPFEPYLHSIMEEVDALKDESGISEWLGLDQSVEINAAAAVICDWVKRQREIAELLRGKCHVGSTYFVLPVAARCREKVMIVTEDPHRLDPMTEENIQKCKDAGISFCMIHPPASLYDLLEKKEKTISYTTYPNYHDETHADWHFR